MSAAAKLRRVLQCCVLFIDRARSAESLNFLVTTHIDSGLSSHENLRFTIDRFPLVFYAPLSTLFSCIAPPLCTPLTDFFIVC